MKAPVVGGGYKNASGTSFSTPYIAGVSALILQKNPEWTPEMVKAALMNTATPLEGYRLVTQGAGALNKDRAVAAKVLAMPPSLSFGLTTIGDEIIREISISNTGLESVTLNLSANTNVYKGDVYPWNHSSFVGNTCDPWSQGNDYEEWLSGCRSSEETSTVVQVIPQELTIPADGTQTVKVKAGPFSDTEQHGWYEGRVTASFSEGSEKITIPFLMHHTPDTGNYTKYKNVIYPGPGFFCANTGYMEYLLDASCEGTGKLVLKGNASAGYVVSTEPRHPTSENQITISTLAAGTAPVTSVKLKYSIDGEVQEDIEMLDDGLKGDVTSGNKVYTTQIGPYPVDSLIRYTVELLDSNGKNNTANNSYIRVIKPYERTSDILLIGRDGTVGLRNHIWPDTNLASNNDKTPLYDQLVLQDLGLDFDYWDVTVRGVAPAWVLQNYLDEGVVIFDVPGMNDLSEHCPVGGYCSNAIKKYLDSGGNLFITGDNVTQTAFLYDYFRTKDNNVGSGVYGVFGNDGDLIGDGIQASLEGNRGGATVSSNDPITWDPNPYWVQRLAENGKKGNSTPTEFEVYEPAEPILTYDSSFLARTGSGGVMKMDSCGSILDQWDLPDDHFGAPRDVAVAPSSEIYVLDTANHKIRVLDPRVTEKFITATDSRYAVKTLDWGAFGVPRDIATDSSGNIYVLDNSNRIFKLAHDGTLITKWGGCGIEEGKFGNASKIVIDAQDEIYVFDTFHLEPDIQVTDIRYSRVHVFDSDGQFLRRWGKKGNGGFGETTIDQGSLKLNPEEIFKPLDLKVDSDGYVWIIDGSGFKMPDLINGDPGPTLSAAVKYDKNGNYIETPAEFYGEKAFDDILEIPGLLDLLPVGSDQGEVSSERRIHFSMDGYSYIADVGNRKIIKFDSSGKFQGEYKPDTNAYWKRIGSRGSGEGEFNFPNGISIDGDGNIYVADTRNHRIQKLDSNGLFIKSWGTKGSGDGEFNLPMGIGVSDLGFVYVADSFNNRIQKFDQDGNFLLKWDSDPATYPDPYTESFGPRDRESSRGKMYFTLPGFTFPKDIAVDSSGDIFVTELQSDHVWGRVQKFSPDGDLIDPAAEYRMGKFPYGIGGTLDALQPQWACGPACALIQRLSYGGVTVTPEGKAYTSANFVGKPEGGIETFAEGYAGFEYAKYIANKQLDSVPWGLDSDDQGNIYITVSDTVGSLGSGTAGLRLHTTSPYPDKDEEEIKYKVVLFGFSLATVQSRLERQQLMARSLRWLDLDVGPIIKQPRYGQMVSHGNKVTLEWEPIEGVREYLLEIRKTDTTGSLFQTQTSTGNSFGFIPEESGWYFWRVKARLSDFEESLWSSSNRFKVVKPTSLVAEFSEGYFCTWCDSTVLEPGEGAISYITATGRYVGVHNDEVNGVGGLGSLTVSPDSKHLYVISPGVNSALITFSRDISTGSLTLVGVHKNGEEGIEGLRSVNEVVVSPDGAHVYVAGKYDDVIVIFSRDTSTGALTFLDAHRESDDSGTEFSRLNFVNVSPDGDYLYASDDDSIRVFSRDISTGSLTFVGVHEIKSKPHSASISHDGKNMYIKTVHDLIVFSREPSTGALTLIETLEQHGKHPIVLSPDGNHGYIVSNRVSIFSRDSSTGSLTSSPVTTGFNTYMAEASSLAVSADGKYVYVAAAKTLSYSDSNLRNLGTLVTFKRDPSTGFLEMVGKEVETLGGVDGLGHVLSYGKINHVAVSNDGLHIYVSGEEEDSVSVFSSIADATIPIDQLPSRKTYTGETLQMSPASVFKSLE